MHFLIFSTLLACAFAAPQGYNLQNPEGDGLSLSPDQFNGFSGSFLEETNEGSHIFGLGGIGDSGEQEYNGPSHSVQQQFSGPASAPVQQYFSSSTAPQQQHNIPISQVPQQQQYNGGTQAPQQVYNGPESQVFEQFSTQAQASHQQYNTLAHPLQQEFNVAIRAPEQQYTSSTQSNEQYNALSHQDIRQQYEVPAPQRQYNAPARAPQQQYSSQQQSCREGEVLKVDGSCAKPIVTKNIFIYAAPEQTYEQPEAPELPLPKIDYNIVFVRTPEAPEGSEPIVIPPPQQKTLVYVLSENGEVEEQRVIEVPAPPPQNPEVFYVNYNDGDNPHLIGGIDLQTALQAANAQEGQSIDNGSTGRGSSSGGGIGNGGSSQYSSPNQQDSQGQYSAPSLQSHEQQYSVQTPQAPKQQYSHPASLRPQQQYFA